MRPWWNLAIPLLAGTGFALVCLYRLAAILHQDWVPDMAFSKDQLHALQLAPLPPPAPPEGPPPVGLVDIEERMTELEREIQELEKRLGRCHAPPCD
jgi:hypothetical protein